MLKIQWIKVGRVKIYPMICLFIEQPVNGPLRPGVFDSKILNHSIQGAFNAKIAFSLLRQPSARKSKVYK